MDLGNHKKKKKVTNLDVGRMVSSKCLLGVILWFHFRFTIQLYAMVGLVNATHNLRNKLKREREREIVHDKKVRKEY